jgi:mRNA-degrading endonuclease RelE of RelBE toxin-antitoxin system
MSYEIIPSSYFESEVKRLSKKYKKLRLDLEKLEIMLLKNPTSGTPLGNSCYKIKIPNSSIPTGKSGGFRLISLVKVSKDKIYLLTIYSKTEQENISNGQLMEILKEIKEG